MSCLQREPLRLKDALSRSAVVLLRSGFLSEAEPKTELGPGISKIALDASTASSIAAASASRVGCCVLKVCRSRTNKWWMLPAEV